MKTFYLLVLLFAVIFTIQFKLINLLHVKSKLIFEIYHNSIFLTIFE